MRQRPRTPVVPPPVFVGSGEPLPRRPLNVDDRPGPRPGVVDSSPLTGEQWHVVGSGLRQLAPGPRPSSDTDGAESEAAA